MTAFFMFLQEFMHRWLLLALFIALGACATNPVSDSAPSKSIKTGPSSNSEKEGAILSEQIVKSPQGYVIKGPKERFGGFIGDCSSDENFPNYWQCWEENAGNGLH